MRLSWLQVLRFSAVGVGLVYGSLKLSSLKVGRWSSQCSVVVHAFKRIRCVATVAQPNNGRFDCMESQGQVASNAKKQAKLGH